MPSSPAPRRSGFTCVYVAHEKEVRTEHSAEIVVARATAQPPFPVRASVLPTAGQALDELPGFENLGVAARRCRQGPRLYQGGRPVRGCSRRITTMTAPRLGPRESVCSTVAPAPRPPLPLFHESVEMEQTATAGLARLDRSSHIRMAAVERRAFLAVSRFGPVHPGLSRDLLSAQVAACRARGIAVSACYCVTWDHHLARTRPQWLVRRRDGSTFLPQRGRHAAPSRRRTSGRRGRRGSPTALAWVAR
jgi:hypothetical protein